MIAPKEPESILLKVGGKPFRCGCGCNVFHHPTGKQQIYQCNACETQYEAE